MTIYFRFLRKFPYENYENNKFSQNFRENMKKLDFFSVKAGVYTYIRSLEKEFFLSFVDKFFTFWSAM